VRKGATDVEWLGWAEGVAGALLALLMTVLLVVLATMSTWGLGGWMEYRDRRDTRTREKAESDLAQYGPSAVGLRDELLPEDLRQVVREARAASRNRWGSKG
jgi:hypothetical protein